MLGQGVCGIPDVGAVQTPVLPQDRASPGDTQRCGCRFHGAQDADRVLRGAVRRARPPYGSFSSLRQIVCSRADRTVADLERTRLAVLQGCARERVDGSVRPRLRGYDRRGSRDRRAAATRAADAVRACARGSVRGPPGGAARRRRAAEAILGEIERAFDLAVVQLEHAEWLAGEGRLAETEPLVAEAREAFEPLRAAPYLERLDRLPAAARPRRLERAYAALREDPVCAS